MTIISDAKRYLHLLAVGVTGDDPNELIRGLVDHFDRYGLQNQLVSRNQQLTAQVVELESRLSEANSRTRAVEHRNVQLEEALKSAVQCQTRDLGSPGSMAQPQRLPSPEILTDHRLEDPNFVPCRDERCSREEIHAQHETVMGRSFNKRKKNQHA